MDDLDMVMLCEKCLHPADGEICPDCKVNTKPTPAILVRCLRILKAKGWVVTKWEMFDKHGDYPEWRHFIRICFYLFAPPHQWRNHKFSVYPEIYESSPSILSGSMRNQEAWKAETYKRLDRWAKMVPSFALPFAQGLCDKCRSQGADWFFSRTCCVVPATTQQFVDSERKVNTVWTEFAAGIPKACPYIVEQTITMPDRYDEMERKGYFDRNPIARKKVFR